MKKTILSTIVLFCITASPLLTSAEPSLCKDADSVCREFASLTEAGKESVIISRIEQGKTYSEGARYYIGKAYLTAAADEKNTPEQEEAYCRKALEYGATQAYVGLYFLAVQRNEEQALGYLREYVATRPPDAVAYVILGESELRKQNYQQADAYLREARRISRGGSARVAWLLFQTNYLLGNYPFAAEMFDGALSGGYDRDLKTLASDARFKDIAKRPEFRRFEKQLSGKP